MARFTEATIPESITVRYKHVRHLYGMLFCTTCYLTQEGNHAFLVVGKAFVSKREKSPSKKIGRNISLGRALKKLSEGYWQDTKGGNYVKRTAETN